MRVLASCRSPLAAIAIASIAGAIAYAPVAPARADDAPLPTPPPVPATVTRLGNGLEVVVHEDHRTPIATVNLWYRVGSKDEAPGKSGFAHLFERIMFQGSKHVPESSYVRYLERAGATDVNGATHTDRTAYYETVPANQLELALWLESDRMAFLLSHLDAQTFAVQRDVVKNERRQNYEDAAYGLVPAIVRAHVYPAPHPYHLPAIGNGVDLDSATLADVRAFFKQWYVPSNATLVIAGDVEPARARALVEKYFGPVVGAPAPPHAEAPPVALAREERVDVRAGVELPRVYVTWPTPAFFAPGDGELDLVARVLAGAKTSRLYKRLVHDLRIAEEVSATQSSAELGSLFEIVATAQPGHGAEELLRAIDDELARLRAEDVGAEELLRAKTTIVADRVFALERDATRANLLNLYAHYVHRPDFVAGDVARYRDATPRAIRDAAAKWLPAGARVVTIVTPDKSAPICGAEAPAR